VALILCVVVTAAGFAQAQVSYKKDGSAWESEPYAYFSSDKVTCSNAATYFPNKSFVKQGLDVRIDAWVQATGHCDVYIGAQYFWSEYRDFSYIYWSQTPPGGSKQNLQYAAGTAPDTDYQSYDTRDPGNGNPGTTKNLTNIGKYAYTFWGAMAATNCGYPTATPEIKPELYSVPCKPAWYVDENGKQLYAPTGDVTIAVPSGFESAQSAAEAAAAAWSTSTGRTVTAKANTTCGTNDPRCVQLTDTYSGSDCAVLQPLGYDTSTGAFTKMSELRMKSGWDKAHPTFLKELVGHEMGHFFGLANMLDASCTDDNTVMNSTKSCYPTQEPNPVPQTGPTPGDKEALNVPYGDATPITCGW
jgi:hypothetical protein